MRHGRGWIWKRWFGRRRGSLPSEWTRYVMWIKDVRITLDGKRGSGYIAVASKRLLCDVRQWWSVEEFESAKGEGVKKKTKASGAPLARHMAPLETEWLHDLMPIVEHCAVTQYDDGDARKVGRITLTTHGSVWQADIKDPDTLQELRVSAPTLDELLALVARLLSSEECPWQPDVWAQQQNKKSKK